MTEERTGPDGGGGALPPDPDRNLALELVRVTEAAAIAAARFMGRGDKEQVDQAAVDAMRPVLRSIAMDGIVVIGEGEKDEAPMLYNGERVGGGSGPEMDVAVDPVDGTTLTAKSLPDALAVIALAERGTMFDPGPCVYMEKIAVSADVADIVDLDAPIADNLAKIAQARGKTIGRHDGRDPRPAAPPRARRPGAAPPARGSSSCSTATSPGRSWPPTRTRRSTCWRASAAHRKA